MATRRAQPPLDHDVRISYLRERVRTGFWFIPLLAVVRQPPCPDHQGIGA